MKGAVFVTSPDSISGELSVWCKRHYLSVLAEITILQGEISLDFILQSGGPRSAKMPV